MTKLNGIPGQALCPGETGQGGCVYAVQGGPPFPFRGGNQQNSSASLRTTIVGTGRR